MLGPGRFRDAGMDRTGGSFSVKIAPQPVEAGVGDASIGR